MDRQAADMSMSQSVRWAAEHDCAFEKDHDGGMTCPVCGIYEDEYERELAEDLADDELTSRGRSEATE
jgi:queuine/archaeosine tRNA-ribosyltransferase